MDTQQLQQQAVVPAKPDVAITVTAEARLAVPAPASRACTWQVGDERIDYTATAGHIDVRSDTGAPIGKMFAVSYVATGDAAPEGSAPRPVTFCYNGGPGSSSVPINFGGIGPRRVKTDGTNHLGAPATVEDNPATLLRQTAEKAFAAIGCEGFARIDFFVRKSDGEVILNEINTIPGFTSISMYPKLWDYCGLHYPQLLDRLIQLGLQRK